MRSARKDIPLQYAVWGAQEFKAALMPAPDAPQRLTDIFSALYRTPVFALNAARVAFTVGLQAFARARAGRSSVLIPAYICPAVVEAVRAAGLVPRFVAVDDNLNIDPDALATELDRCNGDVLAVVVAHMYACPARIDEVCRLAARHDVFVIDDAAHAPGVVSGGRLLGSMGHLGLASFAQSKTLSTGVRGSGGLLIVNDPSLHASLEQAVAAWPSARGRHRALMHFIANYLDIRTLGRFARLTGRFFHAEIGGYQPARIAPLDAALALAQLNKLPDIVAARVRVLDAYAHALRDVPGVRLVGHAPGRYLSRVMVRVNREGLREQLAARGIVTRPGYSTVAGVLIELPMSVTMCANEVARVCDSLSM